MSSLQEKVKELAAIAALVPENLQVTCFEILLRDYLASLSGDTAHPQKHNPIKDSAAPPAAAYKADSEIEKHADTQADVTQADLHVKARKFMEKHSVSINELNNLFYKEGVEIKPLYEDLRTTRMAEAQIRIALLQALHNALSGGEFTADVENIRTECRDRKALDGPNFTANFRNNSSLFDFDNYSKDTTTLRLSEDGKKELAKFIKELQ